MEFGTFSRRSRNMKVWSHNGVVVYKDVISLLWLTVPSSTEIPNVLGTCLLRLGLWFRLAPRQWSRGMDQKTGFLRITTFDVKESG